MTTFTAVKTTGIYCRPGCSARPLKANTTLYDLAAAAEADGFRACLRCRPYRAAVPAFMSGPDLVCRAVGMILDGELDSSTEKDLAQELGVSARHLRRLFADHLGVTPTELARSTRAHFARRLLDDTDLTVTDIAFAAGFGSVRQMNRVFREIFRSTPTQLRAKRRKTDRLVADGGLRLRLPYDGPIDWDAMLRFYEPRLIPGVERITDGWYARTALIDGDPGVVEVSLLDDGYLLATVHLPHWESLIHIARRITGMFGLNSPTDVARSHLVCDPLLRPLIERKPGIRVPGAWDPFEVAVGAILERELSVAEATYTMGRIAEQFGTSVPGLQDLQLTHLFPSAGSLARCDFEGIGVSRSLRQAVGELSSAVAGNRLELGSTLEVGQLIKSLTAQPGVDTATAHYIAFRLGYNDVFPATQMPSHLVGVAEWGRVNNWRPWRSVAAAYLMLAGESVQHEAAQR